MLDDTTNKEENKLNLADFLRLPGFAENFEMFQCLLHDYGGNMDTDEFIENDDVEDNLFELGHNFVSYGGLFIERLKAFELLRDDGIEQIKLRSDLSERMIVKAGSKAIVGEWCRCNDVVYVTFAGTTDTMPRRVWGGKRKRDKADRQAAESMLIDLYIHLTE
ncbi:hypothetical protein [Sulfitobacter sp.]|uniref:hypothetical protein n=1 Tax=Sulfitobacter sp. TaxID=1903071 RepID=UPI0030032FD2